MSFTAVVGIISLAIVVADKCTGNNNNNNNNTK